MKRNTLRRRACAGETLGEVLAALLLAALSALTLAGTVLPAGRIDLSVREADESFYKSVSALERWEGTGTAGSLSVTAVRADGTGFSAEIPVLVYEEGGMIAYQKAGEGTP